MPLIFVSYSREDRSLVLPVLSMLAECGIEYWLDESAILPSAEFNASILQGLRACDWYLLAMTPCSAASEYVKAELHWALVNRNGHIIPVMLAPCDPVEFHLRLITIQHVKLDPGNASGMAKLREALDLVRLPERTAPLSEGSLDVELELISLLLTFIPRHHQKHLRHLIPGHEGERRSYCGGRSLRHELRDLCTWGLLARREGAVFGQQARDGCQFDLGEIVSLTDLGQRLAPHVT